MAGEVGLGTNTSKTQVDQSIGSLCARTRDLMSQWSSTLGGMAAFTDADLVALGYDTEGLAKFRALQSAATTFIAVMTGQVALTMPHDSRAEMSQWWGTGL